MANKNILMMKTFTKIMFNNSSETDLVIPDMYASSIYNIDYKYLKKKKIKNLIFDIDNTIMEVNSMNVSLELIEFFNKLDKEGFNVCVVSNNDKNRVIPVAMKLGTGYIFKANKPKRESFERALTALNSNKENTAMIGDQMLTDIKGAKEFGLYTILVEPVGDKYDFKTGVSRVLQNIMTKKLGRSGKFNRYDYY